MKRKQILLITAVILVISVASFFGASHKFNIESSPILKKHELAIKKIGGEWKVVHAQDPAEKKVKAKKKDKITWKAEGTDVYFQFMDEQLFGRYKEHGKNVTLTVTDSAKLGSHFYAVFCLADCTFATGDSPPEIIVE